MARSSKALELLDQTEVETEDDAGPVKIDDGALVKAMAEITKAIRAAIEKPEAEEPDYTKQLEMIAKMLTATSAASEIKALREDVAKMAAAITGMKSPDMGAVCGAIKDMAATQRALIQTLTAPRRLTFDANGEPNGLQIERVN